MQCNERNFLVVHLMVSLMYFYLQYLIILSFVEPNFVVTESLLAGRHRAATLLEPDNNSFFSSNNFSKVINSSYNTGGEYFHYLPYIIWVVIY